MVFVSLENVPFFGRFFRRFKDNFVLREERRFSVLRLISQRRSFVFDKRSNVPRSDAKIRIKSYFQLESSSRNLLLILIQFQ